MVGAAGAYRPSRFAEAVTDAGGESNEVGVV
jgi:hypothetical protein